MIHSALIYFPLVFVLLSSTNVFAQEGFEFMPDGGKTILVKLLVEAKIINMDIREIAEKKSLQEEWTEFFRAKAPKLPEVELQTLGGYLAVNFPLTTKIPDDLASTGDIAPLLPADGKELAVNQCQFCHSFFTGYLVQDRDVAGWLGTFKAPFHKEIKMSEAERETFARYSAVNMPMKFEDVPEVLRF